MISKKLIAEGWINCKQVYIMMYIWVFVEQVALVLMHAYNQNTQYEYNCICGDNWNSSLFV